MYVYLNKLLYTYVHKQNNSLSRIRNSYSLSVGIRQLQEEMFS